MTREEILAITVGPELDKLVAQTVMGWHREGWGCWLDSRGHIAAPDEWSPSSDWSAAGQVMERLTVLVDRFEIGYRGSGWYAWVNRSHWGFSSTDNDEGIAAPTILHAICHVALIAVRA